MVIIFALIGNFADDDGTYDELRRRFALFIHALNFDPDLRRNANGRCLQFSLPRWLAIAIQIMEVILPCRF